ncbi:hypothetical protein ABZ479_29865 [Streptomyces sp. NPDC005722]
MSKEVTGADGKGFEELLSLGLMVDDPLRPGLHIPAEPERVSRTLRNRAVETLADVTAFLEQLPDLEAAVEDEFRRAQRTNTAAVELILDWDQINGRLARATDATERDVITSHPGRRDRLHMSQIRSRDEQLLRRGVKLRTLYHHTNRHDHWNRKWVAFVTELGAQVRTVPTPIPKMIIFDSREAFIGVYEDGQLQPGALHIRHTEIVEFLRTVFDLQWERADPWVPGASESPEPGGDSTENGSTPVTTPEHRSILWGLSQGKSQKQVAKEHGMSERTLISRLNVLKERLGIPTLPALMYWYGTSDERHLQD